MIRRPPRATRTDTLFPYTTLFRARLGRPDAVAGLARELEPGEVVQAVVPVRLEHLRHLAVQQRRSVPEGALGRSDDHTSDLQSLMRISYAVFCLKTKISLHVNTSDYIRSYSFPCYLHVYSYL